MTDSVRPHPPTTPPASSGLEATAELLLKIQGGDKGARERLVRRFLPILRRWAHGRLPPSARDLAETEDLVQVTLLKALDHIETFEHRREGAFLAYLRRILLNSIRDEIRRVNRRPLREDLPVEGEEAALVVQAAGLDTMLAYERALEQLTEEQQEAVILRIEFGYSHQEIAAAIGSPTANAARMTVSRALVRLAEIMDDSTAA